MFWTKGLGGIMTSVFLCVCHSSYLFKVKKKSKGLTNGAGSWTKKREWVCLDSLGDAGTGILDWFRNSTHCAPEPPILANVPGWTLIVAGGTVFLFLAGALVYTCVRRRQADYELQATRSLIRSRYGANGGYGIQNPNFGLGVENEIELVEIHHYDAPADWDGRDPLPLPPPPPPSPPMPVVRFERGEVDGDTVSIMTNTDDLDRQFTVFQRTVTVGKTGATQVVETRF